MADPTAIPRADEHADEANTTIRDLVDATADAATALADHTAGAGLDVTRIAMHGTPDQLDAWRDTRTADAELQVIVAAWREHWRLVVVHNRRLGNLQPRGLDVYGWTEPEACDHEEVRVGARWQQRNGVVHLDLVHVDLVRVAQQDTTFRLLGPTAAQDLLGADGIIQDGHPLRSGTSHGSPHWQPDQPTWIPERPTPPPPSHWPWDPDAHARAINQRRYDEAAARTGGVR